MHWPPHNVLVCLVIWADDGSFGDTDANELVEELRDTCAKSSPNPWHSSVTLCGNSYLLRQPAIGLQLFPSERSFDSEAPRYVGPAQGFASFQVFSSGAALSVSLDIRGSGFAYFCPFGASLGFACFRPFRASIQKLLVSPAQHKASPLSRSSEVRPQNHSEPSL